MPKAKLDRRKRMRWDSYKRQVLCCLYRFFSRDTKKWAEIFSHMFRPHLRERHINGFISFGTLNTQWTMMRNNHDPVWHHVHIATDFRKDGEWKEIISKIKSVAQTLRLEIQERDTDGIDTSRWTPSGPAPPAPRAPRLNANDTQRMAAPRNLPTPPTLQRAHTLDDRFMSWVMQERNEPETSLTTIQRAHTLDDRFMSWVMETQETNEPETSPYFANDESQSESETTEVTTAQERESSGQLENSLSVVNSHGKVCLWCEQGPLDDEEKEDDRESERANYHDQLQAYLSQHVHSNNPQDQHDLTAIGLHEHNRGQSHTLDQSMMDSQPSATQSLKFNLTVKEHIVDGDEAEASVPNASQLEWPSDDELPDTPTPSRWRDLPVVFSDGGMHI